MMMDRAASALQFVSPIERPLWVAIGMAIQSEFGDAGREMWLDWSRQADSFRELDARAVWKSFKGRGVSIASLYHEAKQNGWRDEGFQKPTREQIEAQRRAAAERTTKEGKQRIKAAQEAAKKAEWILSQCRPEKHAYFQLKGFPELQGLVWRPEQETNLLCIPMFVDGHLSSLQLIDKEGNKKFLSDGITAKAEFCIDCGALNASDWWVEGFASGLSLRVCLHALKLRYRIHVCFSAGNLKRMANSGYVVSDNDASLTGLNAARATGLPYWMPDQEGTDINDFHKLHGTFKTSQELRKWLQNIADEKAYYA
jgi:putative DNA primase/helicase